mmetsp:Transcript_13415/g.27478  ORF Transcript_13415/g.27478 Transcript_13415/m.27478 type:complete len:224 (-) Transcript_13415:108-779(-)
MTSFILLHVSLFVVILLSAAVIDVFGSTASHCTVRPSTLLGEEITASDKPTISTATSSEHSSPGKHSFVIEAAPENLTLPPPAGWLTVISEELVREFSAKVSATFERYADFTKPLLPTNLAVAVSGFVSHKLARALWISFVTYLPPAFLALESLAQFGYIGDKNEGIVQWARESDFKAGIERRWGQGSLPSASEARPCVQLAVDFLIERFLIFLLGFIIAFLI